MLRVTIEGGQVVELPADVSGDRTHVTIDCIDDETGKQRLMVSLVEGSDVPPLGVIVDVWDHNDEPYDSYTFWYEDFDDEDDEAEDEGLPVRPGRGFGPGEPAVNPKTGRSI